MYAPVEPTTPDTSRYRMLPLLERCSHCRVPMIPFDVWSIRFGAVIHTGLCHTCVSALEVSRD